MRGDSEHMVRLDGAGRRYGMRGPWVLRGVRLDVRAGTLVRVVGPNGTGKSTLLRLLARIDAPSEGRVTGRPRTAYVPERFPAALPFTAAGYLTHMGRVHGLTGGTAARRAEEWLARFGAAGHAATPMSELSKGSSQKVAVAQALLADPELLVLDEAWTGLDTEARAVLDRAVAERTTGGAAVVFVDHDPRRLAGHADTTYAITGSSVNRLEGDGSSAGAAGALADGSAVVIDVRGPRGAAPPVLPEAVVRAGGTVRSGAGGVDGVFRLAVAAVHSDLVLRELLTARPPWHVVAVNQGSRGGGVPDARRGDLAAIQAEPVGDAKAEAAVENDDENEDVRR
ncbi:ABC transporter ATP-binding protein [Streptomyces aureoverticillatus]|nr:ABC transporter ATP-binding protein [Streptomyces aureoverticillatus]